MPPPSPLLSNPTITLSPPAPDASRILSVRFTLAPPAQRDPSTTPVLNGEGLPDGDVVVEFPEAEAEGLEHDDNDGEEAGGTNDGDWGKQDGGKQDWEPLSARSDASGHYFHLSRAGPVSSVTDNTTYPTNSKENENENENDNASPNDNDGDDPSPTTTTGPPTALPLPLPLPPSLGPLSTAHLLYHENRPYTAESLLPDPTLPSFFASRPLVQAPSILTPGRDNIVLFRIAGGVKVPSVVRVIFIPRWGGGEVVLAEIASPKTSSQSAVSDVVIVSATSAETKAETQQLPQEDADAPWPLPASPAKSLHTLWAQMRLTDLQALMEVARELEEEGRRGKTTGRVKIGVEGGGMDEEAVRREGWLVGEEIAWVGEVYSVGNELGIATIAEEQDTKGTGTGRSSEEVTVEMDMKEQETAIYEQKSAPRSCISSSPATHTESKSIGLGLGLGLGFSAPEAERIFPVPIAPQDGSASEERDDKDEEDEKKEELFALPLSPRSPDMVQGPFAVWR